MVCAGKKMEYDSCVYTGYQECIMIQVELSYTYLNFLGVMIYSLSVSIARQPNSGWSLSVSIAIGNQEPQYSVSIARQPTI